VKSVLRWAFLAVAGALLVWAIVATWDQFVESLERLSIESVVMAFVLCLLGLFVNSLSWRAVMRSIGLDAGIRESISLFFVSQIGKYVPGSVWPVLAQAEFASEHGMSRARAMTGSVIAMVVGVVSAGVVGAVGLVLSAPAALEEYWWVLPLAGGLVCMLVPAVLRRIVDLVFRLTRRSESAAEVGALPLLESAAWSLAMWLILGAQAWVMLREVAPAATFPLATGAFAFSWLVGFLVVIAPAGVGAREAAFVLALSSVTGSAEALTIAVVSRFLMTAADAVAFGIGLAFRAQRRRPRGSAGPLG